MSSLGTRTGSLTVFAIAALSRLRRRAWSADGHTGHLQETGGDFSTEPSQQQTIPITDIYLSLARKMRADQPTAPLPPATLGALRQAGPIPRRPRRRAADRRVDHPNSQRR